MDARLTPVLVAGGLLALVGACVLLKEAFDLGRVLAGAFVLRGKSLSKYKNKDKTPTWALVTGATDGIGKEFALQLAAQGFSVVIASRTPAKLAATQADIRAKAPSVGVETVPIDFGQAGAEQYAVLKAALADKDVGVLVNNVGVSHAGPVPFAQTSQDELSQIVQININATLAVTQLVLPGMVERRRGLVLNLGSFAGAFPTPLLATYSGSKAFLAAWSQSVASEVAPLGVDVELVNTYFVVSNMSKIRRSSAMIPLPKPYVRQVLSTLGRPVGAVGRAFTSTPWPGHALMDWALSRFVPQSILFSQSRAMQVSIQKRAERKKLREAKQL